MITFQFFNNTLRVTGWSKHEYRLRHTCFVEKIGEGKCDCVLFKRLNFTDGYTWTSNN
jgi:hypothetical protein